jgi:hypothetical protein
VSEEEAMSVFRCENCGCIENTATSNFVSRRYRYSADMENLPPLPALCSECDPEIGQWHGRFPKRSAKGMVLTSDGFLVSPEELGTESFKFRQKHQGLQVVRTIEED